MTLKLGGLSDETGLGHGAQRDAGSVICLGNEGTSRDPLSGCRHIDLVGAWRQANECVNKVAPNCLWSQMNARNMAH